MTIWIDADAAPRAIKEILFRLADRVHLEVVVVANQFQRIPQSPYIRQVTVKSGFDVADEHIVEQVEEGDLVVTEDIPLAAAVIEKGAFALRPRGEMLTERNVRQRLQMRDFMEDFRAAGMVGGGPPPMSKRDVQRFANTLDKFLATGKA